MKKEEVKKCDSCKHFKCKQRELNYWQSTGFCTNDKFRFTTQLGRLIGVYDKQNLRDTKKITGNPTHDIETITTVSHTINDSRYMLQVSEDFGCIYHECVGKTK